MEQWEGSGRFGRLQKHIEGEWLRVAARQDGDRQRWTRNRKMPLADIVRCTLQKKGLSATMEIRQYFQGAGNVERTISKQGYLRQRQQLNPRAFKL
ncbi:hypothetical protein FACS189473_3830 [Spirochaetia bacterium]|nr:hypothetical protein FACS189473_3830 [Spirochaetia bacterium]